MIADSSAIAAIVFREPGYQELIEKFAGAETIGIGAPTLAEASALISARLRRDARPLLARLVQELRLQTVPFGEAHCREAIEAFQRFGRGRHPAALDLGDCMAYATAKLARQPLLAAERRFARTDLALA